MHMLTNGGADLDDSGFVGDSLGLLNSLGNGFSVVVTVSDN